MGHINYQDLTKLVNTGYVKGMPNLKLGYVDTRGACKSGKQIQSMHKGINLVGTTCLLELLHMDLIGPVQTESLWRKKKE